MSPLAILGFLTVIIMLVLIMTKKASPLVALIVVPVVTGIISCFFIAVVPEGAAEGTCSMSWPVMGRTPRISSISLLLSVAAADQALCLVSDHVSDPYVCCP